MSVKMKKAFSREMLNLDAAGLLGVEPVVLQSGSMEVEYNGDKTCLNFIGNDCLGWGANKKLAKAARDAFSLYGAGSTSSRSSIGTFDVHKILEDKLSDYLGLEDCVVFPSGYFANVSLFEQLTSKRDTIFIDEMCNPGLFDGVRLSSANVIAYKHEDYEDLEFHLKCSQNSRYRIIVTDSVFNADGNCANLEQIIKLSDDYDAITVVDDQLGLGILGDGGKGIFDYLKLEEKTNLLTGSFAHGFGNVSGGFVAGDKDLVEWIRHTSRPYILSEPISPLNAAMVLKSIEIMEEGKSGLKKLYKNSEFLKNQITGKGWRLVNNHYPFVSIRVGSALNAQKIVESLFRRNILVSGLCYPNTPEGASLIRINVSSVHTQEQLDQLITALEEAFRLLDKGS